MRLSQLRAFVTAADTGSLSAAARRLGVAQPTTSAHLASLERECEMRLFVRSASGLTLTAAGEALLPWARRAVAGVDGTEQAARALRGLRGGEVTFGVMANMDYYAVSELALHFHRRHPSMRLRLVGQNSYEVARAVRAGDLEAGLVVLPVPEDDLEIVTLGRDEVLWVSADPDAPSHPITIEEAARRDLVLFDAHFGSDDPTRQQVLRRAQLAGVELHSVVEVERVDAALRLTSLGLGDTFAARAVIESPSCPTGLVARSFDPPLYDTFGLIRRQGAPLSPGTEELVHLCRQVFSHERVR